MLIKPHINLVYPQGKGFPYCYSLAVTGSNGMALIDPGAGRDNLFHELAGKPDIILISHFHFDHIHGYHHFPGVLCRVGAEEEDVYKYPEVHLHYHGYDRWEEVMGTKRPAYSIVAPERPGVTLRPGFHPLSLGETISEGSVIDLGGTTIVSLWTPGHTSGHYAFWLPEEEVLFSSDIDLSPVGPWYANTYSSVGDYLASIDRITRLPFKLLVSAHRRPLDNAEARCQLNHYREIILKRNELIFSFLATPHTRDEVAARKFILGRHENEYHVFWERLMVEKHLAYLQESCLIGIGDNGQYYHL